MNAIIAEELDPWVPVIFKLQRHLASTSSKLQRRVKLDLVDRQVRLTGVVDSAGDRQLAASIVQAVLAEYEIINELVVDRSCPT